jgi:hypothetical protein
MSPLVRRSMLKEFLIVVSCTLAVCVLSTLAWGQHTGTGGGATHISSPPISHVPISSAPMIHGPMTHAPISTPRVWGVHGGGALGTAGLPLGSRGWEYSGSRLNPKHRALAFPEVSPDGRATASHGI